MLSAPCSNPISLTYEGEGDPIALYSYSYDSSTLTIKRSFTAVQDPGCLVTYQCNELSASTNGVLIDCDTAGVTTFDTSTQAFTFKVDPSQFSTYPPGSYIFEIRGSIGSDPSTAIEAAYLFEVELADMCPTAELSFTSVAAPSNNEILNYFGADVTMMLNGAEQVKTYNFAKLVKLNSAVNCG